MPKSTPTYEYAPRSPSSSRNSTYLPAGAPKEKLEQVQEASDYPWLFEQPFPDPLECVPPRPTCILIDRCPAGRFAIRTGSARPTYTSS